MVRDETRKYEMMSGEQPRKIVEKKSVQPPLCIRRICVKKSATRKSGERGGNKQKNKKE